MNIVLLQVKQLCRVKFDEEAKETFTKKDGITSLIYFVFYMILMVLFGLLIFKTQIYKSLGSYFSDEAFFRLIFYLPYVIISVLPIFVIMKLRKQSIKSVGIKSENIGKSILTGLVGAVPFSVLQIASQISSGKTLNPNVSEALWTFLYFLICIAFAEELVFRGFLQTRLQSLIKSKWLSIAVVGILFGLMHIPFQMLQANMSLVDFILYDLSHLIMTCIIHIYMVYLYTRDNNIIAPTLAHAIMNFSYAIFI